MNAPRDSLEGLPIDWVAEIKQDQAAARTAAVKLIVGRILEENAETFQKLAKE